MAAFFGGETVAENPGQIIRANAHNVVRNRDKHPFRSWQLHADDHALLIPLCAAMACWRFAED